MTHRLFRTTTASLFTCCLGLGALACTGGSDSAAGPTTTEAPTTDGTADESVSPSETATGTDDPAAPAATPFGPSCGSLPSGGQLPDQPVSAALASVPQLSQLATAVDTAGLDQQLDDLPAGTLFAPSNDAFGALSVTELAGLLADPARLSSVLQYHVVPQTLAPEVAGTYPTLQGGELTVDGSGQDYTVNGSASVVCGGIPADDSTIYVVDTLLTPPG